MKIKYFGIASFALFQLSSAINELEQGNAFYGLLIFILIFTNIWLCLQNE